MSNDPKNPEETDPPWARRAPAPVPNGALTGDTIPTSKSGNRLGDSSLPAPADVATPMVLTSPEGATPPPIDRSRGRPREPSGGSTPQRPAGGGPARKYLIALTVFAVVGLVFAAISTRDFALQLDRQVHAVSCSFVPGLVGSEHGGGGCYTVMMSPYSSVLRARIWGGIPVALPGLSVFAYLLFLGLDLLIRRRGGDPRETRYALVAAALPVLTSVVFGYLSSLVGTLCKVCAGIYFASAGCFIMALFAHLAARRAAAGESAGIPWARHFLQFFEGVVFVAVPIVAWVLLAPKADALISRCGELVHPEDKYAVRVPLAGSPGGTPSIEVLDPLCPACKVFRDRLETSGLGARMDIQAVLFPLDPTCNWMVTEELHPGACAVSEAVLCAGPQARGVMDWALDHNEELRALGKKDPAALVGQIRQRFPELGSCLGTPEVKSRLNKSLRWVASNSLPVLTPQLFVRGRRLCDEDTDLGLEYALVRLLTKAEVAR